jgi:mono/diheme cytochrome c family protein
MISAVIPGKYFSFSRAAISPESAACAGCGISQHSFRRGSCERSITDQAGLGSAWACGSSAINGRRITGEYNSRLKSSAQVFLIALAAIFFAGCDSKSSEKPPELTSQELHGQRLFAGACGVCHRADSTEPLNGPGLKGLFKKQFMPSSGLKVSEQQVRETIEHGRKNMPPMGGLMDEQQLKDLIAYLKTL